MTGTAHQFKVLVATLVGLFDDTHIETGVSLFLPPLKTRVCVSYSVLKEGEKRPSEPLNIVLILSPDGYLHSRDYTNSVVGVRRDEECSYPQGIMAGRRNTVRFISNSIVANWVFIFAI